MNTIMGAKAVGQIVDEAFTYLNTPEADDWIKRRYGSLSNLSKMYAQPVSEHEHDEECHSCEDCEDDDCEEECCCEMDCAA